MLVYGEGILPTGDTNIRHLETTRDYIWRIVDGASQRGNVALLLNRTTAGAA